MFSCIIFYRYTPNQKYIVNAPISNKEIPTGTRRSNHQPVVHANAANRWEFHILPSREYSIVQIVVRDVSSQRSTWYSHNASIHRARPRPHLNIQALHNLGMGQTYVQNDQNTMTKIQAAISGNTGSLI